MSLWFRAYCDALDNPKIQLLDGETFKAWFNLMALAKIMDGKIPSAKLVSFRLRIDLATANQYLDYLSSDEIRLLDHQEDGSWVPHDWNEWQYESDSSTGRVRRFRQKKQSPPVSETPKETPPKRSRNGTEQSRAEQKQRKPSAAEAAEKIDEVQEKLKLVASRIYERHPDRRRDCQEKTVEVKLRQAVSRHCKGCNPEEKIKLLERIDNWHSEKCLSIDWQKEGAEYAKGLENWMAPTLDRYLPNPRDAPNGASNNLANLPGHMNPGLLYD